MHNARMLYGIRPPFEVEKQKKIVTEESCFEKLLLKIAQNEIDIKTIEQLLDSIKLRNRKVKNVIKQMLREESCDHDWLGLHGHPGVYECQKCNKLKKP